MQLKRMYPSWQATNTDGLALQAIGMVFEYLPRAYKNGAADPVAREKMHNALMYRRNGIHQRIFGTQPLYGA